MSPSRRWRRLRAAALVLRLLRSRRAATPTRRCASFRDAFPYESDACCAHMKRVLLRRIAAKPFHCRSDVDVKLLAELLRRSRFSAGLTSASTDALARPLHFRVVHDGEAVFRQEDAIEDASGQFLVVLGSLLVFSKQEGAGDGPQSSRSGGSVERLGECIGTCNQGSICGEDAITGAIARTTTVLAQTTSLIAFVTKADYLRIARFNVEAEKNILRDVRHLFNASELHTSSVRLDTAVLNDRHAMGVIKQFLHRYECFRMLPQECFLHLAQKLQLNVFRPGERGNSIKSFGDRSKQEHSDILALKLKYQDAQPSRQ
ncbi:hypothetical protein PR003_g126 [Phytophthora rubi]|uniref:Cyclic nucleotide-binding domain-containing protein n=1 Tax=Phytophthora rubi TaxID=129364 RepID=A0A6A3PGY0_9STRA|nr:hypothetical protein PR001_g124 [Phytophthora rubi]KAE9360547.1 hypothetical protein PR003_g126 [Phytophthora rubi]